MGRIVSFWGLEWRCQTLIAKHYTHAMRPIRREQQTYVEAWYE